MKRKAQKFAEQFGGNIGIGVAIMKIMLPVLVVCGLATAATAATIGGAHVVAHTPQLGHAVTIGEKLRALVPYAAAAATAFGVMGTVKNSLQPTEEVLFQAFATPRYHEFDCSPGELLLGFDVVLSGNIVISGGTTSGTSHGVNPGGLAQLFEVFAKVAPGSYYSGGTLKRLTPASVIHNVVYDRGTDATQTAINGNAGTQAVSQRFRFNFANPRSVRPIETALRLDQFNFLQLKITNAGSLASMLVGNDRTVDVSGLKYTIVEHRAYNPSYFPPFQLWEDDVDIQITKAVTRFLVKDQISQTEAYMDVLFLTYSNSDLADTLFNNVTVLSNGEPITTRLDATIVRDLNRDLSKDSANTLTGKYFLPVAEGLLTSAVGGLSFEIDLNHPGTDDFVIASRRVTMARIPAKKAA